jgi:hypothetical protein
VNPGTIKLGVDDCLPAFVTVLAGILPVKAVALPALGISPIFVAKAEVVPVLARFCTSYETPDVVETLIRLRLVVGLLPR